MIIPYLLFKREVYAYLMISVCILTKDAQNTLAATLHSAQSFPEVLVCDTGSSDQTLALAKQYANVKVLQRTLSGFGALRNEVAGQASYDWILALDSDEILSPPLLEEIKTIPLDPAVIYAIPRHNFYQGKHIQGCGWHPERVARLYHRQHARYSDALVHERLLGGQETPLQSPLFHTPYRSIADFLTKMQQYSTLFAEQYRNKKSSSVWQACLHGAFAFFRSYIWGAVYWMARRGSSFRSITDTRPFISISNWRRPI